MIPVSELLDHLEIDGNEDRGKLIQFEKAAVDKVQQFTGRYFGPQEVGHVERVDGTGTSVLTLSDPPDESTNPLVLEEDAGSGFSTVTATDYLLEGIHVHHLDSVWTAGKRNFRATYDRGYEAGSEPDSIRVAVKMLVAHYYENREPVPVFERGGEFNEIPWSVSNLLSPYRHVLI